jgi:hypothetical protein
MRPILVDSEAVEAYALFSFFFFFFLSLSLPLSLPFAIGSSFIDNSVLADK